MIRILLFAFFLLTSVLALLAYLPFTFRNLYQADLYPALGLFLHWNPFLRWLPNSPIALVVACMLLVPLLLESGWRLRGQSCELESTRLFTAAWVTATLVGGAHALNAWFFAGTGSFATLPLHFTVCSAVFLCLDLASVLLSNWARSKVSSLLLGLLLTGILAIGLVAIFRNLPFEGAGARVYCCLLASAVLGFGSLFSALPPRISIVVLVILCSVLPAKLQPLDWNGMLQQTVALISLGGVFFLSYRLSKSKPTGNRRIVWQLTLTVLAMSVWRIIPPASAAYRGIDPSYRLLSAIAERSSQDPELLAFLWANTNLPHSSRVSPVPVDLVAKFKTNPHPPHIFVLVVDSLRKDYLSPYNSQVHFTPEIERFARDSIPFDHAYTRYGGTGLSVPSLWTGGLVLHKQYVLPYGPMNTLLKLIKAERYHSLISFDSILRTIIERDASMTALDASRPNMNYRCCTSLEEVVAHLEDETGPLFVYTQPQDLHISVLQREKATVLDKANYKGFYAPYASRVRRLDECFGRFLQTLREKGLYDQSIIILTSDHGDMLGEEGQWGHAYALSPQVLEVPLLVHLPSRLAQKSVDPHRLAFLTDVTPSLYHLLGQERLIETGLLGHSLFGDSASKEEDAYLMAASYAPVYGVLRDHGRSLFVLNAVNRSVERYGSTRGDEQEEQFIRQQIQEIGRFYGWPPSLSSPIPMKAAR